MAVGGVYLMCSFHHQCDRHTVLQTQSVAQCYSGIQCYRQTVLLLRLCLLRLKVKGGRRCSAVVMTTWGVAWQEGVIAVATRQQAVH